MNIFMNFMGCRIAESDEEKKHTQETSNWQWGDLQEPIEKGGTDSIYKAYVREYIPRKYGQKYGTNVPPSIGS